MTKEQMQELQHSRTINDEQEIELKKNGKK